MKTISVVLTTYNSERFIERTIRSIQHQEGSGTRFQLELIVVDDCSTDQTTEILSKLNIAYTSTDRNTGGPNKGRNLGLQLATGDYICIADHDDEWKPHKITTFLDYADRAPVVTSGYTLIDDDSGKTLHRVSRPMEQESGFNYHAANETFRKKLSKSHAGQQTYLGSIFIHRGLKTLLFEENFGVVDFDWILKIFHQNASLEICESLYLRHVSSFNLSLEDSYRRKDFYFSLMTIEEYEPTYPQEVKKAYKRIHGSRARYFYLTGRMKRARFYFLRAPFTLKTLLYFLTSYWGYKYVIRKYNVFG